MTSIFICPICGGALEREAQGYFCENGHGFDLASEGYVNLLPANRKHSVSPGDDRDMVSARSRFLSRGFYEPLRTAIIELIAPFCPPGTVLLDSGCGEGYYTEGLYSALCAQGFRGRTAGIDISKFAVKRAAKRLKGAEFAVASAYHLPVADASVDILLNCFSPLSVSEFDRIVRPGGWFIYVVPAPKHLWALKCAVYDKPYENVRISAEYAGFALKETVGVEKTVLLPDTQAITDLFAMTPYFWKTPREGAQRLERLSALETQLAVDLHAYQKL